MSLLSTVPMLALVAISLAGCSGGHRIPMTRPGATQADWERDNKICEGHAARAAKTQMGAAAANQAHNRVLLSCMQERGWTQPQP